MIAGVDYAWGRPRVAALQAAGVQFVCRYLSHDATGKNLTPAEAYTLSEGGICIVVVWESTASRAGEGFAAGVQDAHDATDQAAACGMPSGRPIYFAVDYDAAVSDVEPYFRGVASVLGVARAGVYGGIRVAKGLLDAGLCDFAWQTYAWSGGQWDSRAQIQQYSNDHVIDGVSLDYDRAIISDYGQWRVGGVPMPQEDDMQFGQLAEGAQAITPISLSRGKYSAIGFTLDNGLQGLPAAQLRVALHLGGGNWQIHHLEGDSSRDKPVIVFDAATKPLVDGISVQREDAGNVRVAYDLS